MLIREYDPRNEIEWKRGQEINPKPSLQVIESDHPSIENFVPSFWVLVSNSKGDQKIGDKEEVNGGVHEVDGPMRVKVFGEGDGEWDGEAIPSGQYHDKEVPVDSTFVLEFAETLGRYNRIEVIWVQFFRHLLCLRSVINEVLRFS